MSETTETILAARNSRIAGVDGWGATPAMPTRDYQTGYGIYNNPGGVGFINRTPIRRWYRKKTAPFTLYPYGTTIITIVDGTQVPVNVQDSADYQYVGCNCMTAVCCPNMN